MGLTNKVVALVQEFDWLLTLGLGAAAHEALQVTVGCQLKEDEVSSLAHFLEARLVNVVDAVAMLVIAGIVRGQGEASENHALLGGLHHLRPREKAAGGNSVGDERTVVRATVERGKCPSQLVEVEVLLVELRDRNRACADVD